MFCFCLIGICLVVFSRITSTSKEEDNKETASGKKSQTRTQSQENEISVSCSLCNMLISKASRKVHMGGHTAKNVSCPHCHKLVLQTSLTGHTMYCCHTLNKEKHVCDLCTQSFDTEALLIRHRGEHMQERPYSCSECAQSFMTRDHLVVHMQTHTGTGEQPYKCSELGTSATSSGNSLFAT
jgi:uncharacterized Zn-finger protein